MTCPGWDNLNELLADYCVNLLAWNSISSSLYNTTNWESKSDPILTAAFDFACGCNITTNNQLIDSLHSCLLNEVVTAITATPGGSFPVCDNNRRTSVK